MWRKEPNQSSADDESLSHASNECFAVLTGLSPAVGRLLFTREREATGADLLEGASLDTINEISSRAETKNHPQCNYLRVVL